MRNELPAWQALAAGAKEFQTLPNVALTDPQDRHSQLSFNYANLLFDFSRQQVTGETYQTLHQLAEQAEVKAFIDSLLSGAAVNISENRPVLHSALRGGAPNIDPVMRNAVEATKQRLYELADKVRNGDWRGFSGKAIRDIVHIGIGGSHLGPELVVTALHNHQTADLRFHFVANVDAHDLTQALRGLNPETTLFIVVSKSFSTIETQINAALARSWFLERSASLEAIAQHFIGITSNVEAAAQFGITANNIYPLWDWVGGRFSLWSAVGLPIILAIGPASFEAFLEGARSIDEHLSNAPVEENIPLIAALLGLWNYNFLDCRSLAVLAYDERLALLPNYLQQLEMESNGKSVARNGDRLDYSTMPVLWGGTGTNGQHAYHQLLHQGAERFCADIILVAHDHYDSPLQRRSLLANGLAQAEAFANGYQPSESDQAHRNVPGAHPISTIVMNDVNPQELGSLLAHYEHKVLCQGALWDINSFDQWGVELGKKLAIPIAAQLSGESPANEGSSTAEGKDLYTQHLIAHLKQLAATQS